MATPYSEINDVYSRQVKQYQQVTTALQEIEELRALLRSKHHKAQHALIAGKSYAHMVRSLDEALAVLDSAEQALLLEAYAKGFLQWAPPTTDDAAGAK
jgi:hypothetical protein